MPTSNTNQTTQSTNPTAMEQAMNDAIKKAAAEKAAAEGINMNDPAQAEAVEQEVKKVKNRINFMKTMGMVVSAATVIGLTTAAVMAAKAGIATYVAGATAATTVAGTAGVISMVSGVVVAGVAVPAAAVIAAGVVAATITAYGLYKLWNAIKNKKAAAKAEAVVDSVAKEEKAETNDGFVKGFTSTFSGLAQLGGIFAFFHVADAAAVATGAAGMTVAGMSAPLVISAAATIVAVAIIVVNMRIIRKTVSSLRATQASKPAQTADETPVATAA